MSFKNECARKQREHSNWKRSSQSRSGQVQSQSEQAQSRGQAQCRGQDQSGSNGMAVKMLQNKNKVRGEIKLVDK